MADVNISIEDFDEDFDSDGELNSFDEQQLIVKSLAFDGSAPHKKHLDVLSRFFGHTNFKPIQWKIINSIINERRDNCAIMATGYGKSLCYQFPSMFCGGVTIVISPLISLMEDQILSLNVANISACLLGTAQTKQKEVIQDILDMKYSLVYLTPEFCCGDYGKSLLMEMNSKLSITLIAVDEAHCVSTWGHDFRQQYGKLGSIRTLLPEIPILAVTATATQRVRNDILTSLKLRNPQILCSGFDRPNLYFSVFLKSKTSIISDLRKHIIKNNSNNYEVSGSTIIYCITRKQTEEIAHTIQAQGITCAAYHAGMTVKQRKEVHEKFVRDKISVIAATIAFGMGIDKPDVRTIIHYGTSRDIETYYQEVGRAGRDGQPAQCVTYYNSADFQMLRSIRDLGYASEKTKKRAETMSALMLKYLQTKQCRRQFILQHFEGGSINNDPKKECCDNCTTKLKKSPKIKYEGVDSEGLYDFTQDAHTFLAAVDAMQSNYGIGMYILFIRGSRSAKIYERFQKHSLHGSGKNKSEEWWKCVGSLLEREEYLGKVTQKRNKFSWALVKLTKKGDKFLTDIIKQPQKTCIKLEPTPELVKLLRVIREEPISTISGPTLPQTTSQNSGWIERKPPAEKVAGFAYVSGKKIEHNNSANEEKIKIYKMLMDKRTELAYDVDCMPYMIASNEVLMNLAEIRPTTINQLRNLKLDGLTEAKISKFGSELIKTILLVCGITPGEKTKRSIFNILEEHPLDNAKFKASAEITYNLFKEGHSVPQIANQRNLCYSSIYNHLLQNMELGHPIKLSSLGLNTKTKNVIEKAIRDPPIHSDMSLLTPIKQQCPEYVTYDAIKAVITYLRIRDHLKTLNCEYEEFDDIENETRVPDEVGEQTPCLDETILLSDDDFESDQALNALADDIEKGIYDYDNKDDNVKVFNDGLNGKNMRHDRDATTSPQPNKKQKLTLLDSPPRWYS